MYETRSVSSREIHDELLYCFFKKRPMFIWGPPGIGKSDVVQAVTTQLNGKMYDLRLSQIEPTDIRGVPFYNKKLGVMSWSPPEELPSEKDASQYPIVVLFLDELNSATENTQAATYQLILNRRIGPYILPKNVVIVAAGNKESDRGVTYRMPSALANRFVHQEMRADFESWLVWAVNNKIHQDIIGFLSFSKKDLYDFEPKSGSKAFATPRSWTFVSQLLEDENMVTPGVLLNLIAGSIGEGLAIKFTAHRKVSSQLPKPEDILDGKVTDLLIKDISAMYSLVIAMCYELKDRQDKGATEDKFITYIDNFFAYMMLNFETEIVVMGARTALTTYDLKFQQTKLKTFDEFHERYGKYIVKASQNA